MFGKRVELYYNGKNKKTSLIGIVFTIIYVIIFLFFFIYKVIKMMKKTEATFYDTYTYKGEPPSIELSNQNFYGGFALEDPFTYDTFVDERIYYPKAYFKRAERNGNNWQWSVKELELERCKLEKFGNFYRDKFKGKLLNDLYCFKEMNETLVGHFSYDLYSLFYISFFPCVNTTENNNHCKSREDIDYYLKNTFLSFQMQDIEMTPQYYNSPVLARDKDIYTTVGKKLFKEIHALFQIVYVETDLDFFGLNSFQTIKTNKFLKYDSISIMSNIIENDIYITGESFCDVTFKLSDKVLTQKRTYTKLVDILSNIEGFMQVIYSFLRIISSFSAHILYEISLVNNLFEFNLDKKLLIIKNSKKRYIKKNYTIKPNRMFIPTKSNNKSTKKYNLHEDEKISQTKEKLNENNLNKSKVENSSIDNSQIKSIGCNIKTSFSSLIKNKININKINKNLNGSEFKNEKNNNNSKLNDKSDINIFNFNMNNLNNMNYNVQKEDCKTIEVKKGKLIKKIKINSLCIYFFFCYVRKRKNLQNILLDEGIKIIIEKLDLINIFKKLYKEDKTQERIFKDDIIKMSYDCKFNLQKVYKSFYDI